MVWLEAALQLGRLSGRCYTERPTGSVEACLIRVYPRIYVGNLFGAGNMIYGGNLASYYVPAHGVGTAIYSGDLAAQIAKTEIQAE